MSIGTFLIFDFASKPAESYCITAITSVSYTHLDVYKRQFTRYAKEHPELDLRVLHFAQVPGTIKRSEECRSGTEQLYHSKKLEMCIRDSF